MLLILFAEETQENRRVVPDQRQSARRITCGLTIFVSGVATTRRPPVWGWTQKVLQQIADVLMVTSYRLDLPLQTAMHCRSG